MLLIEAARITDGGGGVLGLYLFKELIRSETNFKAVISPALDIGSMPDKYFIREKVTILNRKRLFASWVDNLRPTTILCFGNFPPAQKIQNTRVITYFHRLTLTQGNYRRDLSPAQNLSYFLKRLYLKHLIRNTDEVVVQTAQTSAVIRQSLGLKKHDVHVFPFYDRELALSTHQEMLSSGIVKVPNTFIYVSNDAPHKNHSALFLAWEILANKSIYPELLLTLSEDSLLLKEISRLKEKGVNISNLGFQPLKDTLVATGKAEYIIYPSKFESLGLGLVEGADLGCYVLGADLPYTYAAVQPTSTFDPLAPSSIAETVEKAMSKENKQPSIVRLPNLIDDFILYLTNGKQVF